MEAIRYLGEEHNDEELGFVGAALAAAPMAVKGVKAIGKIFKKKKRKKKAAKAEAAGVAAAIRKAGREAVSEGMEPVATLARAVPQNVRKDVLAALQSYKEKTAKQAQTMAKLAGTVDSSLKPHITALIAGISAQKRSNQDVLNRLSSIETRLGLSSVAPSGRARIFGGRNALEGR